MQPRTTGSIRRAFLAFFEARSHAVVPSSPLVPANDPTLLFTNAGMVQFKDVFTGRETRPYTRATSSQKCLRAGGKHNDLENVGYTSRHHTFFEMLGNFSFGDYFKADAVRFAWSFVTETLGLDPDRLAVTVFEGEADIPADDEAAAEWEAVGVKPERIFRLPRSENYWQMGDTGPQGPCSEIHYFMGAPEPGMWDRDRIAASDGWLEIWNLVFMQFVKETTDGPLKPLPKPCVDTGAGLERLAMVMQDVGSTWDTDAFRPLIDRIARSAGKEYGATEEDDVSIRVIADHARATTFLVADGVQPSNEGRGYVLRRIMRRAIRHGERLGFSDLFFHEACDAVVEMMVDAYPELGRARTLIRKVAENEEASFRRTLDRGLKLLEERMAAREPGHALEPAFVADLYDTYGFPIDLTRVIANERGLGVDEEAAMAAVHEKQARGGGGELSRERRVEPVWFELRDQHGPTDFRGYTESRTTGRVLAIVKDGRPQPAASQGEVQVLLDATPFYGESGGQVGDTGRMRWPGGEAQVVDAARPLGEIIVHRTRVQQGTLEVGAEIEVEIDIDRRERIAKNHSATHLVHLALREVLGDHVQQKGSLVEADRLRFDFSHFEPVTPQQIEAIEQRVNTMVLRNEPTQVATGSMDEAQAAGAMMLFGEKYDDTVRMVRIGGDSLELCGGTHVERSGDIGLFKIVGESGVASGIRRIEAVTGPGAVRWVQQREQQLRRVAATLKVQPEEVGDRIEKLVRRSKELERALEDAKAKLALAGPSGGDAAKDEVEEVGGVRVLFKRADGTPKKALRNLADQLRDQLQSGVVVLTAADGDRAALLVAATKDLKDRVHAGNVVKAAVEAIGGSGGGRPDFAQGGAPADRVDEALKAARAAIAAG
jgi:alanyl-tRNA synthetase